MIKMLDQELKAAGIVIVPDYTTPLQQVQDVISDGETFGLMFVSEAVYDSIEEKEVFQYAWCYAEKGHSEAELKKLEKELKDCVSEANIIMEFVASEGNPRLEGLEGKLNTNSSVAKMFMVVVILLIAFLFTIVSNHMIEEESSILGTLFSSGYVRSEIVRHYMILPAFVVTSGAVSGCILGHTLFIPLVANGFYEYYSIPDLELYLVPGIIIPAVCLPIVLILIINFIAIYRKLGITPLKLLRKDFGRVMKTKGKEMKRISFFNRFRMRVLMSSKGSYLMLFIGLILAGWLMMFGMGMEASFDTYKDDIIASSVSEYQYLLKVPYEPEAGIYEKAVVQSFRTRLEMDDRDISITFLGIAADSWYWKELDIEVSQERIYLADTSASKLSVKTGDTVEFINTYTDEAFQMEVTGIHAYANGLYAFMDLESLNEITGNDTEYFNCLFSETLLDIPEEYVIAEINSQDVAQSASDVKVKMESLIRVLEIVAVILYVIVMYLLVKLVVDKHTLNISLLKVFGYEEKEIRSIYLSGTFVTIVVSILAALPIDYQLMQLIWSACIVSLNGFLRFSVTPQVCAMIAGTGVIAYMAVNFLLMRHVRQIDMTEALKDRE